MVEFDELFLLYRVLGHPGSGTAHLYPSYLLCQMADHIRCQLFHSVVLFRAQMLTYESLSKHMNITITTPNITSVIFSMCRAYPPFYYLKLRDKFGCAYNRIRVIKKN
jgi:hypothetical protein